MPQALLVLLLLCAPALAQTAPLQTAPLQTAPLQTAPPQTGPLPVHRLPDPGLAEDAPPSAFVAAARTAIALNRLGEATEAIERAEARLLARHVRPSLAGTPSDQALVVQLRAARAALAAGERATALDILAGVAGDPALDAAPEPSRTGL